MSAGPIGVWDVWLALLLVTTFSIPSKIRRRRWPSTHCRTAEMSTRDHRTYPQIFDSGMAGFGQVVLDGTAAGPMTFGGTSVGVVVTHAFTFITVREFDRATAWISRCWSGRGYDTQPEPIINGHVITSLPERCCSRHRTARFHFHHYRRTTTPTLLQQTRFTTLQSSSVVRSLTSFQLFFLTNDTPSINLFALEENSKMPTFPWRDRHCPYGAFSTR